MIEYKGDKKYQSRKISCFNLTALLSSEICHENALCVAGCCGRDIATKTRRVMCVMTLTRRLS